MQTREQWVQLVKRGTDSIAILHGRDSLSLTRAIVSHDDSPWAGLAPGGLPDLNRVAGNRETIQPFVFPRAPFGLQIHARNGIVVKVFDDVAPALGKIRGHLNVAQKRERHCAKNSIGAYRLTRAFVHENNSREFLVLIDLDDR